MGFPPKSTSKPSIDCAAIWEQCGGEGWAGPTCCAAGSSCRALNKWYHQCWPGSSFVAVGSRSQDSDRVSHVRKLRGRRARRQQSMMLIEVARQSTKGGVSDDDSVGALASASPAARENEL